jgi:hypothetical protein
MTSTPMPVGFAVRMDPDTVRLEAGILFGGSPARIMRLSRADEIRCVHPVVFSAPVGCGRILIAGAVGGSDTDFLFVGSRSLAHPRKLDRS